jgi:hypothetical protein
MILLSNNISEEERFRNRRSTAPHIEGCGHKAGTPVVCYSAGMGLSLVQRLTECCHRLQCWNANCRIVPLFTKFPAI